MNCPQGERSFQGATSLLRKSRGAPEASNTTTESRSEVKPTRREKREQRARAAMRPCVICEGQHPVKSCPERYTKAPPEHKPCTLCAGAHWTVNCPLYPERVRAANEARSVEAKSMGLVPPPDTNRPAPPAPCPRCGGLHWVKDCRVFKSPLLPSVSGSIDLKAELGGKRGGMPPPLRDGWTSKKRIWWQRLDNVKPAKAK